MEKRLIWISLAALLTYGILMGKPWETNGQPLSHAMGAASETKTVKLQLKQVHTGNLLLVNAATAVPDIGVLSDIVELASQPGMTDIALANNQIRLSGQVAERLAELAAAARKDGIDGLVINSGYRTLAQQERLYEEEGAESALPPGYSEHNLGLSVDIGSVQGKMDITEEGRWMEENAWKYGFVLRYPPNKTDITGIKHEPWHFRYVGLPHSVVMQKQNMVLEEYLDYLKEVKSYQTTVDGKVYMVEYYPVSENTEITLPANAVYEVSGNNTDGVIVTSIMKGGGAQ
ncbi:M15 family metallopeptidase [Paenibacillus pasadenensis]|uniref:M15 family metallopeptidase n=1 Tax=Paenibacillus pasadenensis TaxID=217090 RepID=UPI00203AA643|nr:D-alanyl-D-alanine carboxypeptidase family protein [Paenibacillus pasadenensis]MCM3746448.1 M15 family metallopeptidase [Paenibacillus pasadenensis]